MSIVLRLTHTEAFAIALRGNRKRLNLSRQYSKRGKSNEAARRERHDLMKAHVYAASRANLTKRAYSVTVVRAAADLTQVPTTRC